MDSKYQWNIKLYKVTRWLNDKEVILLGSDKKSKNVIEVWHAPGHTPDSLILWYHHDERFFVGDLFHTYNDILLTYVFMIKYKKQNFLLIFYISFLFD